jgi:hypothetical protein
MNAYAEGEELVNDGTCTNASAIYSHHGIVSNYNMENKTVTLHIKNGSFIITHLESISSDGTSSIISTNYSSKDDFTEEKYKDSPDIRSCETEVFVAVIGKNLTKERFKVLNDLWDHGIKAEILYNENPRMDKQMDYTINNKIPFMVFIGENELKENKLKIKCMANGTEITVEREKLVEEINKLKENPELLKVEGKK